MPLPAAPVAKKLPVRIEQLGRVRTDDYAWMKDDAWQKVLRDPSLIRADIKAHLDAENAYTKAMLASTEPLQAALFAEMKGRVKEDDSSVPAPDGPWDYYSRFDLGAQHPLHVRRPRGAADGEVVLLDEEATSKEKTFYQTGSAAHSPDHRYFAWAEDTQGSEVYRVHVRDIEGGELVGQPIESVYDFTWSPDSKWLFWVLRDDHGRPAKVYRRPLGGGPGDDVLVYDEPDDGFFVGVGTTSADSFIVISSGDHETSEARVIPAADPTAAPAVIEPRTPGLRYSIDHWDGRWVILTNADGAVDFKLAEAPIATPGRTHWTDLVGHRPGRFITGFGAYKDYLVRLERVEANTQIIITERAINEDGGRTEKPIVMDEEAYVLSLEGSYEYDTTVMRYVYQSPTTPRQTFDYDMATGAKTLRKTQEIPSGHDPSRYVTRRLFATANDGAQVPITVLMKAGLPLDGAAPLLLYGYGAYGIAMDPSFSIRNLSLVDRGWIYAVAHVRGGTEKGYGWFLDGRKDKKTNSFTDFIACAEQLAAQGYGAKGRIVAYGGSAGGMLMGAIANMRPDLWAGVIGAVPFIDVLNTMSDTSLPLTPPEWPEWGNPITDADAYDYIASYSPYDNIAAKPYPAVLATGGLSDPRVTYWEPAKWAASLRGHTTSGKPVLLKINMDGGHGGASGRFDFLKEIALDYAFAIWAMEQGWLKT